ncbi:TonB-dependent receptor domain-containing protein [Alistipes provencensis]|uniref:TonB-dependent receptor domain-containing protein n=1 Tax=Alistipes provencensis TaxID=1816676 RepID=UPI0007ED6106|nr:TonB-dependent receptor [Alistipes provencensis]
MLKSRCCLLFLLLPSLQAAAQSPDDEYYPYAEREERREVLTTDSAIFYRAVQGVSDLYGDHTDFNLPQVAHKRRGLDYRAARTSLSGVDLPYRYLSLLRLLGAGEERYAGLAPVPGEWGPAGGVRLFRFPEGESLQPYLASVRFTDRNYLFGAKVAAAKTLGDGWSLSAAADARTGRDMHVEGVFTNALTAGLRLAKRFGEGHELALLCIVPPSTRGTRLSSSEEAFSLTGDRLYNPAWGFQDGRVRNSRVRRETIPLAVVTYEVPLSPATSLTAAFGAEAGVSKYSMLDWYDARTPMPDNYRYLPSYAGDRETELAWRSNDTHYTQVDWDELIRRNRMAAGHAVYALEDRAERLCNLSANALLTTDVDGRLTLRYGVALRRENTRSYRQMRDLLGAEYITDIDRFLVDDDTYSNLLQNDLRHPDRTIRAGDRFGYDYTLTARTALIHAQADYRADRFRADLSAELGSGAVSRRGHYEKELFPGAQSYGRSRVMRFTPYAFRALAGWAFTPRCYLEAAVQADARMPEAENLFYQPLYNNRTVDNPVPERTYAAELGWRFTGPVLDLQATVFAVLTLDGTETRRYYDDMASVYCDMAVTGIGRLSYGIEAAADIRLSYRWRLSLAASAGRYKYARDPVVTVLSDVDNSAVDLRAVSRMGGCETGGAPQLTATAELAWFGSRGWGCRASAGYAGRRYVEPMALRRTDRIAGQGGITREAFEAFTRQERLADAFTLDASLFKSFYFDRSRLTAALMLRNLLGDADTPYGGYESLRVRRIRPGDDTLYTPHATRCTYAWPRSFYLTISYRF